MNGWQISHIPAETAPLKPYILSDKEERLLALHAEGESVPRDAFSVLTNVDIDFGTIDTPEGPRPLSQSTCHPLWINRPGPAPAGLQGLYKQFDAHKTTLAALYGGSVKQDG
jgi:oligoendopeptidase F